MTIPLATTTITVLRRARAAAQAADPWDATETAGWNVLVSGVAAALVSPSGGSQNDAAARASHSWRLVADPCPLDAEDRVVDEATGLVFDVEWVEPRAAVGLEGLEHVAANVLRVTGAV